MSSGLGKGDWSNPNRPSCSAGGWLVRGQGNRNTRGEVKSAFGIKLLRTVNLDGQPMLDGDGTIVFWKDEQGWCGLLTVGGFRISETIGSSSAESCYRSLRGRAA